MQNIDDELCTVLNRASGLLEMIKNEIEARNDSDYDNVLAVIDVLDGDISRACKLIIDRPVTIEEEAA